ncbi:Glucosamine-fructose-6-phosphate aminotransferase, isomerising like protein [Aduncisulcus paluster]|uniref:glutamine--fructose-6-phosphate transaminase (isomerizing) n=1 Tax=Aduncisulcus paluster TaxID=2918883 RepID=A0ABQ5KGX6_9EUKA|nr:Glucosamine-fructose-6-phosphate aminotransferase, isomerising like protein [Aduncisulcus paluster]
MCGIFGLFSFCSFSWQLHYTIKCLHLLSYRGYDSVGICYSTDSSWFSDQIGETPAIFTQIVKSVGDVDELVQLLRDRCCVYTKKCCDSPETSCVIPNIIAHTRWATHGPPTPYNAHPVYSDPSCGFMLCHNGQITNYQDLLDMSTKVCGTSLEGSTDSEVLARFILFNYLQNRSSVSFPQLLAQCLSKCEGSFAVVAKSQFYPNELVASRKSSPLLVAIIPKDGEFVKDCASKIKVQPLPSVSVSSSSTVDSSAEIRFKSMLKEDNVDISVDTIRGRVLTIPHSSAFQSVLKGHYQEVDVSETPLEGDDSSPKELPNSVIISSDITSFPPGSVFFPLVENDILHLSPQGFTLYSSHSSDVTKESMDEEINLFDLWEVLELTIKEEDGEREEEDEKDSIVSRSRVISSQIIESDAFQHSSEQRVVITERSSTSISNPQMSFLHSSTDHISSPALFCEDDLSCISSISSSASLRHSDLPSSSSTKSGSIPSFESTYMFKEIMYQPKVVSRIYDLYSQPVQIRKMDLLCSKISKCRRILFLSCGTSYFATLAILSSFEHVLELNGLNCDVYSINASTRVDDIPRIRSSDVCIMVTQSGETADVLKIAKKAVAQGATVAAITNSLFSSATRIAGQMQTFYINAGVEVAVASTKAFSGQILTMMLLLSYLRGGIAEYQNTLSILPDFSVLLTNTLINSADIMQMYAAKISRHPSCLVVGRGKLSSVAYEGALKMKEVSYIHAEGIASGDLKHGTLALVHDDMPVIYLATPLPSKETCGTGSDSLHIGLSQITSRVENRDNILVIATEEFAKKMSSDMNVIIIPSIQSILKEQTKLSYFIEKTDCLQLLMNVVPLQLLSLFSACTRGWNVDKPRNLAKSVTVL